MRIFSTYPEAINEIRRDLKEMGVRHFTKTMQNKNIEGNPDFATLELQNYIYTIINPDLRHLEPTQPWANAEWAERQLGIQGNPVNPGTAWELRSDVWKQFLVQNDRSTAEVEFDYSYSERFAMYDQVHHVIERLKEDKGSRQLYVTVWAGWDSHKLGKARVPCSLGYHFMMRGGQLNMTYFMRSCDFSTHFQNDLYLARMLQTYVAQAAEVPPGQFTHFIASMHVYQKDVANVF